MHSSPGNWEKWESSIGIACRCRVACHSRRGGCRAPAPAPAPWRGLKMRRPRHPSLCHKPIWCLPSPWRSWTLQIPNRKRFASLTGASAWKRNDTKRKERHRKGENLIRWREKNPLRLWACLQRSSGLIQASLWLLWRTNIELVSKDCPVLKDLRQAAL